VGLEGEAAKRCGNWWRKKKWPVGSWKWLSNHQPLRMGH
jgi:hypothetical protein